MLFEVGTHLTAPVSEAVTPPSSDGTLIGRMRARFGQVYLDLREEVTIKRSTTSYSARGGTDVWNTVSTTYGVHQGIDGETQRREVMLEVKSDAKILMLYNEDIEERDKVYRADGSWMYVNYVHEYKGHKTAYLTRVDKSL